MGKEKIGFEGNKGIYIYAHFLSLSLLSPEGIFF